MQNVLVVVDMQNDFIDGALGSADACAIVERVFDKIDHFDGTVLYTRDTHGEDYLDTQEGRNLPIPHCVRNTHGWEICSSLEALRRTEPLDKPTFGSRQLGELLARMDLQDRVESVTFVGLCTDICVISNAILIKAFLPEAEIIVDAACCAGVTPESHKTALAAMKACQIRIDNDN